MRTRAFFIVGVGRSGTSLLQSMLAAHPRVSCLPETSFIRRRVLHRSLESIYKKHGRNGAVHALAHDAYFARTRLVASEIVAGAVGQGGSLDAAVYRHMLTSYANERTTLVGDKDPRTIEYLPMLARVLPDAHVIHVFRDPRDVLVSKKKAAWSKEGHVWKHVFANRVQFRIGRTLGPALFGERYHEVCYEQLIASPETVLSRLCANLGIDYDSRMLSFGDAAENLVSGSEMSWKKETLGPLLTQNTGKWKSELHPKEVLLTELCCSEAMARGGYEKDTRPSRLTRKDKLWLRAGRLLILAATWPYTKYRNLSTGFARRRMR
ncbi:MAG: sulfotransferase family protein [Spirochaetales bacterium]